MRKPIKAKPHRVKDGRCQAFKKGTQRSKRCGLPTIKGGNVCHMHGGSASQVIKAARQRLLDAVDPMLAELHKLATDPKVPAVVRRQAVDSMLDRAGLKPSSKVELTGADAGPLQVQQLAAMDPAMLDASYRQLLEGSDAEE